MKQLRVDINAMRALAVTAVVIFHFHFGVLQGGFAGVDVFFVISGFLMTAIIWGKLDTERFRLVDFYLARMRRIIPALIVVCLALLLFGGIWFDPLSYRDLGKEAIGALLFVSNIQFWMQAGYFDSASETKLLLHTWSLSVEWQFYILYPLILMFLHRFVRSHARHLVLAGAILSFSCAVYLSVHRPELDFFLLPTRAWEMALGGLPYLYRFSDRLSLSARRILTYVGVVTILASFLMIDVAMPWPAWGTLAPVLGAVAVLVGDDQSFAPFSFVPVKIVGAWSYSIYLWHWPIFVSFTYLGFTSGAARLVALLLVLLLSAASYYGVERDGLRRLRLDQARTRAVACGLFLAVFSLATVVTASNGFPTRFGGSADRIEKMADAEADWDFPSRCGGLNARAHALRDCRIGSGPLKILLAGDSYAEQLYPRMVDLANRHPEITIRLATDGGCPPLPDVDILKPGSNCLLFNQLVDQEALSGHYDTVVIASVWEPYFRSDEQTSKLGRTCVEVDKTCLRPKTRADLFAIYDSAFDRLSEFVSRLQAGGAKVVVVAATPFPRDGAIDLPLDLVKREFLRRDREDITHIDVADFLRRTQYVRERLEALAKQTGATLIDPMTALCSKDSCPTVDGEGFPLLRDSAHLRSSVIARVPLQAFDRAILPPRISTRE